MDEPRFRRHRVEDTPQQRYATPEEIAGRRLPGRDASSFMTGSVVVVDGGCTVF